MAYEFVVERLEQVSSRLPITQELLLNNKVVGLHCGSGRNFHVNWLNADDALVRDRRGNVSRRGVVYLVNCQFLFLRHDARHPFPIEDKALRCIFAEHFVEHLEFSAAIDWLREMRRLLQTGGCIRISTPDLAKYAKGYAVSGDGFSQHHQARLQQMGVRAISRRRAWMMNQIFRDWGHRWIYDFDRRSIAASGGTDSSSR